MKNEQAPGGCLLILGIIMTLSMPLLTGYLAWQWCTPNSFWGFIQFIFLWIVIGGIVKPERSIPNRN